MKRPWRTPSTASQAYSAARAMAASAPLARVNSLALSMFDVPVEAVDRRTEVQRIARGQGVERQLQLLALFQVALA